MTSGPLQGRSLRLVGRADPRGETEYNFALGSARAGSVDTYLIDLGLDSARVSMTSRGKLDATGTDETGGSGIAASTWTFSSNERWT